MNTAHDTAHEASRAHVQFRRAGRPWTLVKSLLSHLAAAAAFTAVVLGVNSLGEDALFRFAIALGLLAIVSNAVAAIEGWRMDRYYAAHLAEQVAQHADLAARCSHPGPCHGPARVPTLGLGASSGEAGDR